jgi:tetratricopeptide (TPR) repeat protein
MRRLAVILCLFIGGASAGCASAERAGQPPRAEVAETAEAAWRRGRLLANSRRYADAEAAYRRAIELGEPRAMWSLAWLLRNHMKRLDEAETYFRRCLDELPDGSVRVWPSDRVTTVRCALRLQLAELYLQQRRLDDARRLLETVLEEDPDCWVALELLGDHDFKRDDAESARARYAAARDRIGPKEAVEAGILDYKLQYLSLLDPFW